MSDFDTIKNQVDLLAFVRHTTGKQGKENSSECRFAPCPLCLGSNKNAAFSITKKEPQVFHCFACNAHGNIFHFAEKYFNCNNLNEAREKVMECTGVLPKPVKQIKENSNEKPQYLYVWEDYSSSMLNDELSHWLMTKRSFPSDIATKAIEFNCFKVNNHQGERWLIAPAYNNSKLCGGLKISLINGDKKNLTGSKFKEGGHLFFDTSSEIIIFVESVTNALCLAAIGYSSVCLFGKSGANYIDKIQPQIRKGKYYLWLDQDGTEAQRGTLDKFSFLIGIEFDTEDSNKKGNFDVNDLLKKYSQNFIDKVEHYIGKANDNHDSDNVELPEKKSDIPIDLDAIHPHFGKYLEDIEGCTDAPKEYIVSALLSSFAGAIGNKALLKIGRGIRPNLYMFLIGESTFMRKTTSMSNALKAISILSNEKRKEYNKAIKDWNDTKKEDRGEKPKRQEYIYPDNVTPAQMLERMQDKPDGIFKFSEIATLLAQTSSYPEMKAALTDLYDCPQDYEKETKTAGRVYIENPCPNIIGASTMEWLQDNLKPSDLKSGFLGRFCYVIRRRYPEKFIAIPDYLEEEKIKDTIKVTRSLAEMQSRVLEMSKNAKAVYELWYNNETALAVKEDPFLHSFLGRLMDVCHKIAIINHFLSQDNRTDITKNKIEEESYSQAFPWIEFFAKNIKSCYSELTAIPDYREEKILNVIEKKGKEAKGGYMEISQSKLCQFSNLNKKELEEIIDTLILKKYIRRILKGKYVYFQKMKTDQK